MSIPLTEKSLNALLSDYEDEVRASEKEGYISPDASGFSGDSYEFSVAQYRKEVMRRLKEVAKV